MSKVDSVEGLLSPSLRVSRPVAACSRCRSAKIKCDGKLPACTACEKAGKSSSCSGANDDFARGKERSYVAALEGACERLQKRIAEIKATQGPDMIAQPTRTGLATQPLGKTRTIKQEASDVDDLVGDFGFLSVNATSRDFHGFTGTTSFAKLLLTVSLKRELPLLTRWDLPPRYYATQLIEQYLASIHVLMPVVSETGLMASLAAVYQDMGCKAKAYDHWAVRLVLGIATASNAHRKDVTAHRRALHQVSAALEYAEEVLHPGSITGLQAILLVTQYSMIDPEYIDGWQLIGMASRVLVDLGLHQDPSAEARISKDTLDLRRRVFSALYCMDRQISMACNQPFSFTDDSIALEPPVMRQSSPESDVMLFIHSIRPSLLLSEIRKIQSKAYQVLCQSGRQPWEDTDRANSYVWSVYASAQEWHDSIPVSLSPQHQTVLKLELIYTQLVILSPSIRIPSPPDFHKGLFFGRSLEFVEMVHTAIQNSGWHPFLTFYDVLRIQNITRVFLANLWGSYNQILSGHVPEPPYASRDADSPQPLRFQIHKDMSINVDHALHFFQLSFQILDFARQRWRLHDLGVSLEHDAATMLSKLRLNQAQLQQRKRMDQGGHDQHVINTPLGVSYPSSQSTAFTLASQSDQQWPTIGYKPTGTDRGPGRMPPLGQPSSSRSQTQMGQHLPYGMTGDDSHLSRNPSYSDRKSPP